MKFRLVFVTSFIASLMLIFVLGVAEARKPDKKENTETSNCTQTIGAFPGANIEESDKQKPPGLKGGKQPEGQKEEDCSPGALPQSKDG